MSYQLRKSLYRPTVATALLGLFFGCVHAAFSQNPGTEPITPRFTPQVPTVSSENSEEAAPISPAKSPGPMSLDKCLDLGFEHQPALDAARASLAAAHSGQRGVNGIPRIAGLFARDLRVRRSQASHGITIADAALMQAEWDTRYSITRNFFTVQYIRAQQRVIDDVLRSLNDGYAKVEKIVASGDPDTKVTTLDLKAIRAQIALVKVQKSKADNGMLKALAALREAMGLRHDYPLEIAVAELPPAVYEVKTVVDAKDAKGKAIKKEQVEYRVMHKINKEELIKAAVENRGEMIQASAANQVMALEIDAQARIRGIQGRTFAAGGDIHVQPIPAGVFNNEYKPGAIGPEMPGSIAGRKWDRVERARNFYERSNAVVEKTTNLVSLDVEAQYLKWQEAADDVRFLKAEFDTAQGLPAEVLKIVQNKDLTGGAIIQANLTAVMFRTQLNDAMHMHALALAGLERATAGAFRVYPVPVAPASVPK